MLSYWISKLHGAGSILQAILKRDKAAEAVVEDPDRVIAEQEEGQRQLQEVDERCSDLKQKLPVLEQQLRDKKTQLQDRLEIYRKFKEMKAAEVKAE